MEKPCVSTSDWLKGYAVIGFDLNTEVTSLHTDSREVESRGCFVALTGEKFDGRDYMPEAASRGAALVIYDPKSTMSPNTVEWLKNTSADTVVVPVPNLPDVLSELSSIFYQNPSQQMMGIGVTGTNGKSSVAYIIASAMSFQRRKTGYIGTLGVGTSNKLTSSNMTTPNAVEFQKYLAEFVDKGFDSFVYEASSHGLALNRTAAVSTDIAVMTNFGMDHSDFHPTRNDYLQAKEKLFAAANRTIVLNLDDPHSDVLIEKYPDVEVIGYSTVKPHATVPTVLASDIKTGLKSSSFRVSSKFGKSNLTINLSGLFQVENALAALSTLLIAGCDFEVACSSITEIDNIPGRMQWLKYTDGPDICVDYAHNAASLEAALSHIKSHVKGKVWCIFGCGGDRDPARRAEMGKVAERYSDHVIITDDNPRTEDPEKITNDILEGMLCKWAALVEHDRATAIAHAINNAEKGDAILIAGKGHETYQEVNGESLWFSDVEQALNHISEQEKV